MDIQQKVNLAIVEEFAKHGIAFAFPTQTVYVNSM
jgi:small-conductance mechanosensitive channel